MIWMQLIVAGLLEVGGAVALKYSDGFGRVGYTLLVIVSFAASFYLLSGAAEVLPIGTTYLDRRRRGRHCAVRHIVSRGTGKRKTDCQPSVSDCGIYRDEAVPVRG